MAIVQFEPRTPTLIQNVEIILTSCIVAVPEEPNQEVRSVTYRLEASDDELNILGTRGGNLVPELTAEEITWLQAFMDKYRAVAEGLLPPV